MKIISLPFDRLTRKVSDPLLKLDAMTIGVFDGLHIGHRHLFESMLAKKTSGQVAVVTFSEHPRAILTGHPPARVLDWKTRNRILSDWKIDWLVVLETNRDLLALEAETFVELIFSALETKYFVTGPNFRFGRERKGSVETIRKVIGDRAIVVEPRVIEGETASSTAVRKALAEGNLDRAEKLLGRHYAINGFVKSGDGIGRTIASPTLNIEPVPAAVADGIYAVMTSLGAGVAHLGSRPTFDKPERRFEVHLLEPPSRAAEDLDVAFIARIRDVQKFDKPEQLREAIASDVKKGTEILKSMDISTLKVL